MKPKPGWLDYAKNARVPTMSRRAQNVRFGRPFREITNAAKERRVDLIITGTHGFTGLRHLQLGSTAEKVVRYAPCPVMVVREQEHEFVVPGQPGNITVGRACL